MITQEMIRLYDDFTHGLMSRRDFVTRLAILAGSTAAAQAAIPFLENNYRSTGIMPEDSAGISAEYLTYPGVSGEIRAYHARPYGDGPHPAVIVIHENRGLNPHIEDVTRRVANAGFWAFAPDALSTLGGTPEDADLARERIRQLDDATTIGDFAAAVDFAEGHDETTRKTGCVGFCWGGRMANMLAVRCSNLHAAVAFYGSQPPVGEVPNIRAAIMLHYAGLDERINAGIADYEDALKAAGIDYTMFMYEDVHHAFHNDTAGPRYDQAAARLAWSRTIAFFNSYLRRN